MSETRGSSGSRFDVAVILARGQSSRMGRPKGLLKFKPEAETFARTTVGLYKGWARVVLVTTHDNASRYRDDLKGLAGVDVLGCDPGGETALTVWHGWRHCSAGDPVTHVWAHPVDMPLVHPDTLLALREKSSLHPRALIRPQTTQGPGHPVVIPDFVLHELGQQSDEMQGAFREFINKRRTGNPRLQLIELPSEDPGVVKDFDCPGDLA